VLKKGGGQFREERRKRKGGCCVMSVGGMDAPGGKTDLFIMNTKYKSLKMSMAG